MTMTAAPETKSSTPATAGAAAAHYKRPDWFTRNVMNRFLNLMMRLGISVLGSRVLEHRGRRSGQLHHTPVNLLTIDGTEYLVSPRGETEWVRNVKAADGHLVLAIGRRRKIYTATEVLAQADRVEILRTYLRRWKFEVGMFFDGVGPDSSDEEFAAVADRHPVFVLRNKSIVGNGGSAAQHHHGLFSSLRTIV